MAAWNEKSRFRPWRDCQIRPRSLLSEGLDAEDGEAIEIKLGSQPEEQRLPQLLPKTHRLEGEETRSAWTLVSAWSTT